SCHGSAAHVSPYDIHDQLVEQGEKIDTVSIYRILDRLEAYALAHRVAHTGGFLRCRFQEHQACRHGGSPSHLVTTTALVMRGATGDGGLVLVCVILPVLMTMTVAVIVIMVRPVFVG